MAGGPGLLPGSLPTSQAQGQGGQLLATTAARGVRVRRALLDRRTGSTLSCCGLSTRLGRAVCQGLQVPAWIPAPSRGASREAGCRHLPPSGCTCFPALSAPSRPSPRGVGYPGPPHSSRPFCFHPDSKGRNKRWPGLQLPVPPLSTPCPAPGQGRVPPPTQRRAGASQGQQGETFPGLGGHTFQTPS